MVGGIFQAGNEMILRGQGHDTHGDGRGIHYFFFGRRDSYRMPATAATLPAVPLSGMARGVARPRN